MQAEMKMDSLMHICNTEPLRLYGLHDGGLVAAATKLKKVSGTCVWHRAAPCLALMFPVSVP